MPAIALAQDDGSEDDESNRWVASIEKIVRMGFGPSTATREVQYVTDLDRLLELVELALTTTSLADIESAIASAVSPPK